MGNRCNIVTIDKNNIVKGFYNHWHGDVTTIYSFTQIAKAKGFNFDEFCNFFQEETCGINIDNVINIDLKDIKNSNHLLHILNCGDNGVYFLNNALDIVFRHGGYNFFDSIDIKKYKEILALYKINYSFKTNKNQEELKRLKHFKDICVFNLYDRVCQYKQPNDIVSYANEQAEATNEILDNFNSLSLENVLCNRIISDKQDILKDISKDWRNQEKYNDYFKGYTEIIFGKLDCYNFLFRYLLTPPSLEEIKSIL